MSSINKVLLMGHLGDSVKLHYFEGGSCIGKFPIATNETYTNKTTGELITTTEWHNIIVKNKLAETCEKYLTKGDHIYLEGRIKTRQWQDDSGSKHYVTEIHVKELKFIKIKKKDIASEENSKK